MRPASSPLLLGIFAASGFAALVYEVVWVRLLSLTFGSNMGAVSVVVATFLLGIALGGALFGGLADRKDNPLSLLAALEVAIGISALLFPPALKLVETVYVNSHRIFPDSQLLPATVQIVLCVLLLLPPTLCMGGTLPVVSALFRQDNVAQGVGIYYASNVVGAACGAFATGYFLIPAFGLSLVVYLACSINFVIALSLWVLGRGRRSVQKCLSVTGETETPRQISVLICTMLLGFCALVCQMLWTRALVLFLGSTTYAFSGILSVNLLGVALGSLVFSRLRSWPGGTRNLFIVLPVISGIFLLLSLFFYDRIPYFVLQISNLAGTNWAFSSLLTFLLIAAVIGLPAMLSGALFPAAAALYAEGCQDPGRHVGQVVFFNTLGSGAGALVGAVALVPLFGLLQSFKIIGLLQVLAGALFVWLERRRHIDGGKLIRFTVFSMAGAFLLAILPLRWDHKIMNSGMYYYAAIYKTWGEFKAHMNERQLLATYEGREATVTVQQGAGGKFFTVNGKVDGSDGGDMQTQILLGQLPVLLHADPQQILVIGLGTGVTTATAARYPAALVETVEISPEVVKASKHFGFVDFTEGGLRNRLHVRDARNFLLVNESVYDVIISEPSNPWQVGNANLFTVDFFRLVQARLSSGGVFCQWLPVYDLDEKSIKSIIATFMEIFPHAHFFVEKKNIFILGSNIELKFDYQLVNAKLAEFYRKKSYMQVSSAADLLAKYYLFSTEIAREYAKGALLNTDEYPVVEYSPRYNIAHKNYVRASSKTKENLFAMLDHHKQTLPINNLGSSEAESKQNIADILENFTSRRKDFVRIREQY